MAAASAHRTTLPSVRTYDRRTFREQVIEVDDSLFEGCSFHDSELVYRGGTPPGFFRCSFENCEWTFLGAASSTLKYLSILLLTLPPEQRSLVDGVIQSIREGTVLTATVPDSLRPT